jgi:hypothetical protein
MTRRERMIVYSLESAQNFDQLAGIKPEHRLHFLQKANEERAFVARYLSMTEAEFAADIETRRKRYRELSRQFGLSV